jgi:amidase
MGMCRIVQHVSAVLTEDSFMTIPTAPGPAPALDCTGEELETFRARALALTSIAGLCGLPQVTLPVACMDHGPVGLGIIGPRGSDAELLLLAERLADTLSLP